ncbi:hypothetical protein CVT25_003704, partial [Psilocybe cyanescens]
MSKNNTIRPFNPFSLQNGMDDSWHRDVLRCIAYGDSRLRTALLKMMEAENRHQGWMQTCLLKESYKYNWWNNNAALTTLDNKKLNAALSFHREQLKLVLPRTAAPSDDGPRFRPPSPTPPPMPSIDLIAVPKIPAPVPGAAPDCPMCDIYQKMAVDLYQMNVDAVRHNRELLLLAETESSLCERRVAGFYELHEAAMLKETANVPARDTESGTAEAIPLPDHSHWTWGESLTREDVLGLGQSQQAEIHTGYGIELEDRNIDENDSQSRITVGTEQCASTHSGIHMRETAQATVGNVSDDDMTGHVLIAAPVPDTMSLAQMALRNMSDDDEVEIISTTNVRGPPVAVLVNMSDDDEIQIVSVPPTSHSLSRAALANMSDDDEVEIISSTNNMQSRACPALDVPAPAPALSPSVVPSRARVALDNMSDDDVAFSHPADFRSRARTALANMSSDDDEPNPPSVPARPYAHPALDIPAPAPALSPSLIRSHARVALDNMSDDEPFSPPTDTCLRARTALANMSSDDEPNPPSAPARSHVCPALDVPALYPSPSCPPTRPIFSNMVSDDDEGPAHRSPYPYSLPPDSSE